MKRKPIPKREKAVRAAVKRLNLPNYEAAAKHAGVSVRTLYNWRHGITSDQSVFLEMMVRLGIDPRDFMGERQLARTKKLWERAQYRREYRKQRAALVAAGAKMRKDGNKLGLRRVRESIT